MSTGVIFILGKGGSPILASGVKSTWPQGSSAPGFSIYTQLKRQAFLCIDEIEASMHPNLMEYILAKFINTPDNQSQLLVSTHYDPILKDIDDLFGKDSVWFTGKGKDGNTTLFSLVDFKGLNKLSSIHRAYMNGQFGVIPQII